jgi:hypothetical protein
MVSCGPVITKSPGWGDSTCRSLKQDCIFQSLPGCQFDTGIQMLLLDFEPAVKNAGHTVIDENFLNGGETDGYPLQLEKSDSLTMYLL